MKYITGKSAAAFAALLMFSAPFAAGALSVDDLQAQLKVLLEKVASLQVQIRAMQSASTTVSIVDGNSSNYRICALLERDLSTGSRGDDVSGLQEYLHSEGYFNGNVTGYFGPLTSTAVAKWQSNEGVTAGGYFGPISRERLKIRCGGGSRDLRASPTSGAAPLTVNFYTNISGFRVNTISYTLDFGDGTSEAAVNCNAPADACVSPGVNTHTYTQNGTYTATLNKVTNTCPAGAMCFAGPMTEVVAKVNISVGPVACTKEYRPVCGGKPIVCITTPCNPVPTTYSNTCAMNADGATFLYEGQCKVATTDPASDPQCKAWYDGCNSCSRSTPGGPAMCTLMACLDSSFSRPAPYCKEYFGSSTNKPPVISGFSGPTTLAVGQSGTWSINASDPENMTLSYGITWGDETNGEGIASSMAPSARVEQRSSFTHTYSSAGTYTVRVTVTDGSAQGASATVTVKVGGDGVVCTMEYAPVCGQPPEPACRHSIPACMIATPGPTTYSNRCMMNAAGATFLYNGACTSSVIDYSVSSAGNDGSSIQCATGYGWCGYGVNGHACLQLVNGACPQVR